LLRDSICFWVAIDVVVSVEGSGEVVRDGEGVVEFDGSSTIATFVSSVANSVVAGC